jgi:hypothetical protein
MRFTQIVVLFLALSASFLSAQDAPAVSPGPARTKDEIRILRLKDFERITMEALRQELPRFSTMFASVHSCRLPDYGPLISITLQPPPYYFTRPVLVELERRQRIAEEQARRIRNEIDRAAQVISLKAREAGVLERVEIARSSKKKSDQANLEKELAEIRKSLQELEPEQEGEESFAVSVERINELDLTKMMLSNYEQLIKKLTVVMKKNLSENGVRLVDVGAEDRVCITTHIRENFVGNQEKSLIFLLNGSDIQAFRNGAIDLPTLTEKVVIKQDEKD